MNIQSVQSSNFTIIIPTYNRPESLLRQVEEISRHLPNDWRLLIIDNASDVPATEVIKPLHSKFSPGQLRVHRNDFNVGLSGNIIKCFELSPTEWMWIVSDDDKISPSAYQFVNRTLQDNPSLDFLSLGSNLWPQNADIRGATIDEFFRPLESLVNITLITTNVYRVPAFRPYLRFGYLYGYSLCPSLAMILVAIAEGKCRFLLSSKELVNAVKPSDLAHTWSFMTTSLTISSLLELPLSLSDATFSKFAFLLQQYVIRPKLAVESINNAFHQKQKLVRTHLMRQIFQRNFFTHRISYFRTLKMHLLSALLTSPDFIRNRIFGWWGISVKKHEEKDLFGRI